MENPQALKVPRLEPVEWSIEIDAMLLPAFDNDSLLLHRARKRVASGTAQLLGVFDGPNLAGVAIITTEGDEGVIVAVGGRWEGGAIIEILLPVFEAGFKAAGCASCRIETIRRGVIKKIAAFGYHLDFIACRKDF